MKVNTILLFILIFIIASCNGEATETPITLPPFNTPEGTTYTDNNDLTIQLPSAVNTFRAGDAINILIYNTSSKDFVFNYQDTKLYQLDVMNSIWQEVLDNSITLGSGEIKIKKGDSVLTVFNPTLSNQTNNENIAFVKIVIIGNFLGNDGNLENDKKVMIIDLKLNQ